MHELYFFHSNSLLLSTAAQCHLLRPKCSTPNPSCSHHDCCVIKCGYNQCGYSQNKTESIVLTSSIYFFRKSHVTKAAKTDKRCTLFTRIFDLSFQNRSVKTIRIHCTFLGEKAKGRGPECIPFVIMRTRAPKSKRHLRWTPNPPLARRITRPGDSCSSPTMELLTTWYITQHAADKQRSKPNALSTSLYRIGESQKNI